MSSSVASRGTTPPPPSRSASTIAADRTSGYHLLRIDGYSLTLGLASGQRLESCPFTVGGHRWRIHYYPNGLYSSNADFISAYLKIDDTAGLNKSPVTAQYKFSVVDESGDAPPPLHPCKAVVKKFTGPSNIWGQHEFIERDVLEESGHLRDDCFTIRCDVTVIHGFRPEVEASPLVRVPPPDLHRHLAVLLESKKGADVVFDVAGETFSAHRCVLAARSSVFSAELFGPMKEGGGSGGGGLASVVHVHDMEPQVFETLLAFMYTDSLPEVLRGNEEQDAVYQHLLVAADRYGVERLKLMCERVSAGTAATVLELAEQHQCHGLRKACLDIIGSAANRKAFVSDDGFEDLCRSCPSLIKDLIIAGSPP